VDTWTCVSSMPCMASRLVGEERPMLLSVHDGVKSQHTSDGEFRFERTPTDRFRLASLDTNSDTGTSILRLPCINNAFPDAYEQ
jgi:hypothetical protein